MAKNVRKKKVVKKGKQVSRSFSIPLNHPKGFSLLGPSKVEVPREIEVPIFLIRNELQARMLFNALNAIGFSDCYFETYLHPLILASLRLRDGSDETFRVYTELMEKWSKDINPNKDVILRRALKIYNALIKYRIDMFETFYVKA